MAVVHDSLFRAVCDWEPALEDLAKVILRKSPQSTLKVTKLSPATDISEGYERDVAFCVGNEYVILCEHQSTWNPNMPLRMLRYVGRELYLEAETRSHGKVMYGTQPVAVRIPKLAVFYPYGLPSTHSGRKTMTLRELMPGGDKERQSSVDLTVQILAATNDVVKNYTGGNWVPNLGRVATELSILQRAIKGKTDSALAMESTIEQVVAQRGMFIAPCIEQLKKKGRLRALTEYEWKRQVEIDEGKAEGKAEGRAEGKAEGKAEVIVRMVAAGVSFSDIAMFTGLSIENAQKLYRKYSRK